MRKYHEFFPGYRVGRDGFVWRQEGGKWVQLGARVTLHLPNGVSRSVSHIVLTSFVGPKPKGCVARRRDGDRFNNALSNLYWGKPGGGSPPGSLPREVAKKAWRLHGRGLSVSQIVEKLGINETGPLRLMLQGGSRNDITGIVPLARKNSVFGVEQVLEIVSLSKAGKSPAEIARELKIPPQHDGSIRAILDGKTWSYLTGIQRK